MDLVYDQLLSKKISFASDKCSFMVMNLLIVVQEYKYRQKDMIFLCSMCESVDITWLHNWTTSNSDFHKITLWLRSKFLRMQYYPKTSQFRADFMPGQDLLMITFCLLKVNYFVNKIVVYMLISPVVIG